MVVKFLIVMIGSAIGGAARYWLSGAVYKFLPENFPYGTLVVNVTGSFILGFIFFYLNENNLISPEWRLLLTTGFCGGLTTFSTFSYETVTLLNNSDYMSAMINVLSNNILSILAVISAYFLAKMMM